MKMLIVTLILAVSFCIAQEKTDEKPVPLSKAKVQVRVDALKREYQELQKLVDDPTLAVPNWKARMRQIEGQVGAFQQSIEDTTLFVLPEEKKPVRQKK